MTKNVLLMALIAFTLSGCFEPEPEEVAALNAALPAGCTFHDVGRYGEIDRLVFISCEGLQTISTTARNHVQVGKSSYDEITSIFCIEGQ